MIKRIISILMTCVVVVTFSVPCFAFDNSFVEMNEASKTEQVVERAAEQVSDSNIVVSDYEDVGEKFEYESEDIEISVPFDPSDAVVLNMEGTDMEMALPDCIEGADAVIAQDGSVVYNGEDDAVDVCVQVIGDNDETEGIESVRTAVIINDETAPDRYDFDFKLPKGNKLVFDYEYGEDNSPCCGSVYVIDANGESVATIEPAWAIDANGEDVDTHYEIEGTTLVQYVDFTGAEFPIVADPTTHPDEWRHFALAKSSVKELRDTYSKKSKTSCGQYIIGVLISLGKYKVPGIVFATVCYLNDRWNTTNRELWSKMYDGFNKGGNEGTNRVKFKVRYKWHGGHKAYAPTNELMVVKYYKE